MTEPRRQLSYLIEFNFIRGLQIAIGVAEMISYSNNFER